MELFFALGVDSTIWIQFTLTLLIFLGLSQVAFKPFMDALIEREGRTLGSVEKANKIAQEVAVLQQQYELLARELNSEIKSIFKQEEALALKEAEEMQAQVRASEQKKLAQFKENLAQQIAIEKMKIDQWIVGISSEIVKKALE
jgi:F0F1-type ATP synthase membrane subunit b/b'